VKQSYRAEFLLIGRGGSFKKISRYNRCTAQRGTRVYSDVPRVTFFTSVREIFVETDRQSQPASPRG
jgi:hypothetical protein